MLTRRNLATALVLCTLQLSVACVEKETPISTKTPGTDGGGGSAKPTQAPPILTNTDQIHIALDEISRMARAIDYTLRRPSQTHKDGCLTHRVIQDTQGRFLSTAVDCKYADEFKAGQKAYQYEFKGGDYFAANRRNGQMRSERLVMVRDLTDLKNFAQRAELRRTIRYTLPSEVTSVNGPSELKTSLSTSFVAVPMANGRDGEKRTISAEASFVLNPGFALSLKQGSKIVFEFSSDASLPSPTTRFVELEAIEDMPINSMGCPRAIGKFRMTMGAQRPRGSVTQLETTLDGFKTTGGLEAAWSNRCLFY